MIRKENTSHYDFSPFCEGNGIVHQVSTPYTPQQNGMAERKNRILVHMVNSMISLAKSLIN